MGEVAAGFAGVPRFRLVGFCCGSLASSDESDEDARGRFFFVEVFFAAGFFAAGFFAAGFFAWGFFAGGQGARKP